MRATITLSWPMPSLWPNRRAHPMVLHRTRKPRRKAAWAATLEAGAKDFEAGPIIVHVTAYPPTAHARDGDNLVAALKADFDGISDAIRVDDRHFRVMPPRFSDPRKPGEIVVTLEQDESQTQTK